MVFCYYILKGNLLLWWQSWIFSMITPVLSVTWSFRNHPADLVLRKYLLLSMWKTAVLLKNKWKFYSEGCIKLIKIDSKDTNNVTKNYITNKCFFNIPLIKDSWKKEVFKKILKETNSQHRRMEKFPVWKGRPDFFPPAGIDEVIHSFICLFFPHAPLSCSPKFNDKSRIECYMPQVKL